jgi:hypothetical protein
MVRLMCTDGAVVKFCREYIYNNQLGAQEYEDPLETWASDTEGALLANDWDVSNIVTNTPNLDKTEGTLAYSHVLEFDLDDQDDEFGIPFITGIRQGRIDRPKIAAGKALQLYLRHLDSDATKPIQYQIRELRRAATDQVKYWDGSAWQTTAQWVDVTGSATEAVFADAITADESGFGDNGGAVYQLWIRPKSDYAAETSHVADIGVHEVVTATDYDLRIAADGEYFLVTQYRCRIGVIADQAAQTLYVAEMEPSD